MRVTSFVFSPRTYTATAHKQHLLPKCQNKHKPQVLVLFSVECNDNVTKLAFTFFPLTTTERLFLLDEAHDEHNLYHTSNAIV